jgi:hypothetical protein
MQVVKTKEGKIEETGNVVTTCRPIEVNSEHDFKALGLASFFDTHEDNNVDWEDVSGRQQRVPRLGATCQPRSTG